MNWTAYNHIHQNLGYHTDGRLTAFTLLVVGGPRRIRSEFLEEWRIMTHPIIDF
jgi:hypothetical protein